MPDTKIIETALDIWFAGENWRDLGEIADDYRRDMRAALTAALALVTPGAGLRDQIEALRDFRPGSSEYNRGLDDALKAVTSPPSTQGSGT